MAMTAVHGCTKQAIAHDYLVWQAIGTDVTLRNYVPMATLVANVVSKALRRSNVGGPALESIYNSRGNKGI